MATLKHRLYGGHYTLIRVLIGRGSKLRSISPMKFMFVMAITLSKTNYIIIMKDKFKCQKYKCEVYTTHKIFVWMCVCGCVAAVEL